VGLKSDEWGDGGNIVPPEPGSYIMTQRRLQPLWAKVQYDKAGRVLPKNRGRTRTVCGRQFLVGATPTLPSRREDAYPAQPSESWLFEATVEWVLDELAYVSSGTGFCLLWEIKKNSCGKNFGVLFSQAIHLIYHA
jgi:hypothetical protein